MSDQPAETPVAAPKPSPLPMILGGANLAATLGILAVLLLKAPQAAPAAEPAGEAHAEAGAKEGTPTAGPTMRLSDIVVKLRDPDAARYARLSMELELKAEPDREKLTPYVPRLRDAFVTYLSDRKPDELIGSEALAHVKAEMLKRTAELVPNSPVRALYFTDFVVQ